MISFAYNPTSWDDGPIPGGMADLHIRPVTAHLNPQQYRLTDCPQPDALNVYYTHRPTYGLRVEPGYGSVFAGHGIADKGWRPASRMAGVFDHVVSTGPHWTDLYTAGGVPPERVLEVGYPKLDPIFNRQVRSPWPARTGKPRVLWAPTHGGGGEHNAWTPSDRPSPSSQWRSDQILGALDGCDVMIARHPRHRVDKTSTLTEYVGADVVVADGGSTIYEAWACGLPVVFPTWLTGGPNLRKDAAKGGTLEGQIYRGRVGRHASGPRDFRRHVLHAASHRITVGEVEFLERVLPARLRDGKAGARFAAHLTRIEEDQ